MFSKLFRLIFPALSPQEIKQKYNIPDQFNAKIRITNDGYFVLTCEELPGLITEARDGKELLRMFNDAVLTYFDVPRRIGDVVHNKMNIDGHGTFLIKTDEQVLQVA